MALSAKQGCIITDFLTALGPNGVDVPLVGVPITVSVGTGPIMVQQNDGTWPLLDSWTQTIVTDGNGMYSVTVPAQLDCFPSNVLVTITIPAPTGLPVAYQGAVTRAMVTVSQITPLTLRTLINSYTWNGPTLVSPTQIGTIQPFVSVRNFSAAGDGATDDTQPFLDAMAAGNYVVIPDGVYAVNLALITAAMSGHTFASASSALAGISNPTAVRLIPYDTSKPVVTIGNDTAKVEGITFIGVAIDGQNNGGTATCDFPIQVQAGATSVDFINCATYRGRLGGIKIAAGPVSGSTGHFPISGIRFSGFRAQSSSASTVATVGIYSAPFNVDAGYTIDDIELADTTITNATAGYAIENDGVADVYLNKVKIRPGTADYVGGIHILQSQADAPFPHFYCDNLIIGGSSSRKNVKLEWPNTLLGSATDLSTYLKGTFSVGWYGMSDGTAYPTTGQGWVPQNTFLSNPAVRGVLSFLDPTVNFYRNDHHIGVAHQQMWVVSAGAINLVPSSGGVQVVGTLNAVSYTGVSAIFSSTVAAASMGTQGAMTVGDTLSVSGVATFASSIAAASVGTTGAITAGNGFGVTAGTASFGGDVQIAEGKAIVAGTTTGLKIGTAATQKIGFYGAAPIVRPSAAAVATDAASTQTLANAIRSMLINFNLWA